METSHEYQVDLSWKEGQNARVSTVIFKDSIELATHSCLSNLKYDVWSAEHLFIASVESSYMAAFFKTAKNKGIRYKSFKSVARASVVVLDDHSEITDIVIKPVVTIVESRLINKTLKIFSVCKDHCLVLNALKVRLHIFPSVIVEEQSV